VAHLCTRGEAPWLRAHTAACERFGALKSAGMAGREEMFAIGERARARAARLLGVEPGEVAFLAHSSEGLNQAVRSVEWHPGDNVVFADVEYPSLIYPAARLRERGVERLAPSDVERHAQGLGTELIEGLRTRGWPVITPEAPEERGGNVCFLAEDAGGLAARLAAERVLVWGGEGRIRVSPHVHDDRDDLERFFEALDRVGARPGLSTSAR
jgi:selenocysteine lyase/cysteine desulfurase